MTSASTSSDMAEKPVPDTPQITTHAPEEVLKLPKRPSPVTEENFILHGEQPPETQVLVLTSQAALIQVSEHSESNMRSELGGVLLGHVYREGQLLIVEIKAALPAHSNDHGPVHFTFTADAWSQIHRDRAATYSQLEIVGWFHTHPGLGVFYSSDDVVVHSAAFTLPWHIGLVVDPIRNEAAFFGWEKGKITPIIGYYELTDTQPQPIVAWRAVRTSVYNVSEYELAEAAYADGETAAGPKNSSMVYMPDNDWFALSPSSQKLGLIIGTIGLSLALFMLLFGVVPLSQRAHNLEMVLLTMANSDTVIIQQRCPDPHLRLLSPQPGVQAAVGARIEFIGTAQYPGAVRHIVEARLVTEGAEWVELGSRRGGTNLDTLATWNTTNAVPGVYEVRLVAVDRSNIIINDQDCILPVVLQ